MRFITIELMKIEWRLSVAIGSPHHFFCFDHIKTISDFRLCSVTPSLSLGLERESQYRDDLKGGNMS